MVGVDLRRLAVVLAKHAAEALARTRSNVISVDRHTPSYGGAVITEAGNDPKVAALVYVAAFAPDNEDSRK